jgi:hypothetical protein
MSRARREQHNRLAPAGGAAPLMTVARALVPRGVGERPGGSWARGPQEVHTWILVPVDRYLRPAGKADPAQAALGRAALTSPGWGEQFRRGGGPGARCSYLTGARRAESVCTRLGIALPRAPLHRETRLPGRSAIAWPALSPPHREASPCNPNPRPIQAPWPPALGDEASALAVQALGPSNPCARGAGSALQGPGGSVPLSRAPGQAE